MSLAQELKTVALAKLEKLKEEAPQALNKEALKFILEKCQYAAEAGYFYQEFILDTFYEKHFSLEKQARFYEASGVLELLKNPELGFLVYSHDTGEKVSVGVQWGECQDSWTNPIYVEVTPPEEYLPFIKKLLRYGIYQ